MQTRYGFEDRDTITVISPSQQIAISRFMTRTYGWMFLGTGLTGIISYLIASSENLMRVVMNPMVFGIAIIAELAMVLGLTFALRRISAATATLGFLAYSALNGVTLSWIFLAYTMTSIGQVFLITAGMFGGLALFGTVTKKDLTGVGSFVGMGLWGLILVGLVNMFVRSESLSLGLSVAAVLIFTGLTAWDAQKIKAMAYGYTMQGSQGEAGVAEKGAIMGALALYLDFINLFLALLRLFGSRRE